MAKKVEDPFAAELKKLLAAKRLIIGTERTLKKLRQGALARVYISKNCAEGTKDALHRSCAFGKADCVDVPYPNDELGTLCKKPFAISVIGVTR